MQTEFSEAELARQAQVRRDRRGRAPIAPFKGAAVLSAAAIFLFGPDPIHGHSSELYIGGFAIGVLSLGFMILGFNFGASHFARLQVDPLGGPVHAEPARSERLSKFSDEEIRLAVIELRRKSITDAKFWLGMAVFFAAGVGLMLRLTLELVNPGALPRSGLTTAYGILFITLAGISTWAGMRGLNPTDPLGLVDVT
jgi:hypothetical protein